VFKADKDYWLMNMAKELTNTHTTFETELPIDEKDFLIGHLRECAIDGTATRLYAVRYTNYSETYLIDEDTKAYMLMRYENDLD